MPRAIETVREAAAAYAARGIPVLPLYGIKDGKCTCGRDCGRNAGKHPHAGLVPNGLKDASTEPEKVGRWFRAYPEGALNIGIVLRDMLVIDEDQPGAILAAGLELPNGPVSRTGRGHHYLFKLNGQALLNGNFAPGLDCKTGEAYIVAPPSMHVSGKPYAWVAGHGLEDVEPQPIPESVERIVLAAHASNGNGAAKDNLHDIFGGLKLEAVFLEIEKLTPDSGDQWRQLMLRVIRSLVGRGWRDDAIAMMCRRGTRRDLGFTHEQTDAFVADEIRRTRHKDKKPEPDEDTFDQVDGEAPWPDPIPLFAEYEKSGPYPIGALSATIRAAVQAYQTFGQQPLELVACSALAAASLACQALVDIDRDGNLLGPCSLSFMTVAVSGERKTACDKRMRRALANWENEKRKEMAPAIRAAERRLAIWEAKHDGLINKIKRLSGSTRPDDEIERKQLESKVLLLDSERPHLPPQVKLFHEDTTPEKLAVNLSVGWPTSSLWSDEGGLVVGSHAMGEDSALRFLGLLNRLWDGGTFDRQRASRDSAHVRGRRFTVSIMLQPGALAKLTAAGDGIARGVGALARFLMAWPSSTIGTRPYREGDLDGRELRAFDVRLQQLLNTALPLDEDGALEPPVMLLSREAFDLWRELHDDVEGELGRRGEFSELPDFGAKAAEQAARIASVLHVFEHGPTGEIGPEMMLSGAQIVLWHLSEARRIFSMIGHSGEASDAQVLLEWLVDQAEEPTLRDVLRLGPYRLRDKHRRDGAIEKLTEHSLARVEKRGQAEYLVLNPKVSP